MNKNEYLVITIIVGAFIVWLAYTAWKAFIRKSKEDVPPEEEDEDKIVDEFMENMRKQAEQDVADQRQHERNRRNIGDANKWANQHHLMKRIAPPPRPTTSSSAASGDSLPGDLLTFAALNNTQNDDSDTGSYDNDVSYDSDSGSDN